MKRITLSIMLITAGAVGAQVTPTPPVPARPPAEARPTPAPRAIEPPREPLFHLYRPDVEMIRGSVELAREQSQLAREHAELLREHSRLDVTRLADEARLLSEHVRGMALLERPTPMPAMEPMLAMAPMPTMAPMTPMPPMPVFHYNDDFKVARPYFVQGEPSDSLWRLAHDLLGRGDYGRSAQMFKDIAAKYPNSAYQNDLPYWEAFARYRIGTTQELETAARLLEPRASKLIGVVQQSSTTVYDNRGRRGTSEAEVTALYVRINSALASRGNNNAAAIVAKAAQAGTNTCDRDDMQVKVEAMSALTRMDPNQALPIVRRVLEKKDDCNVELRKRAVFILGQRGDSESASLLATAAKSDPSIDVRMESIGWLPKVQGDAGVNMLEELLRTDQEERIQRAVVRTLNSSDNQRARSSMRALIDRKDAPTNLRVEAINSFNNERATADDAAYLRGLYSRADNDRVKEAIINAIARIGGPENEQWVLNLARNPNETSQFRAVAISRLMRSNISIGDLNKLYDASDSYEVRSRIVNVLESRREPEAADKLVDIIRNSTVLQIRTQALRALSNKKDPRAAQLYLDILDGKKP